jgi:cold-inducible RNA-binding protein
MNNKLYVGNLSFDTNDRDLQEHFSQVAPVREVTLINDKFTGRSRGFGFVVMEDEAGAQAAIAQLNDRELAGRNLTVNIAREREDRPAGGGGGRGPGGGGGGRDRDRDRRPSRRF